MSPEHVTEVFRQVNGGEAGASAPELQFVLYANLAASSSKSWLVHNMLGAGEMSAFYGPPGCGKGVIIEDMALHIAAGLDWHGRAVSHGAVLYVALERKKLVERRAIAFREKHGLQDLPFAIAGGVHDFRQPETAHRIAFICRQVKKAVGQPVVLIIIDTVSRALCGGDENSPKDMGALVMTAGLLQQECPKAHVLWVHHIPHDSDRLRGHGALLGAVDTSVSVSSSGTVRTAKVVKANDSEEGESVAFTIESVVIAPDGTTAPVAMPVDGAAATSQARRDKWPKGLKFVRDAIAEAVTAHGKPHRVNGDGPAVNAVDVKEARRIHMSRYVSTGDGDRDEAERKAWRRNLMLARQKDLISGEVEGGVELIWLAAS